MAGKSDDAVEFRRFKVGHEDGCGIWGYLSADLDVDCDVDLADLSEFVLEWLYCTEVGDPGCYNTWIP